MSDAERLGRATAGRLLELAAGRLSGEIRLDGALRRLETVTLEVFAHGILFARAVLRLSGAKGDLLPFAIPLGRFPQVALPCVLAARLVETDGILHSAVTLADPEDLWARLVPFRVSVERVLHDRIFLRADAAAAAEEQTFGLYEDETLLASSRLEMPHPGGEAVWVLPLPDQLLDSAPHRLVLRHENSGLPVTARPLQLRLDVRTDDQPALSEIMERLAAVEQQMRARYAEAFNGLAQDLYRHVDALVQHQRSNFEREVSALRGLLGLAPARPAEAEPLPSVLQLSFAGPVQGYGIHSLRTSGTGKAFRYVAPVSGVLLPGIAAETEMVPLRIQGLRRSHPDALEGAVLAVNGIVLPIRPYASKTSESWNIAADVPAADLRPDRNIVELRLPRGLPAPAAVEAGSGGALPEEAVGIMHLTLGEADPGAAL